ncbi:hypothetical protein OF001_U150106 [Pseudomonas sp. OF001]|nr:hypothetical protein OF001_U150106 [Pseudomonas sp. OF001]
MFSKDFQLKSEISRTVRHATNPPRNLWQWRQPDKLHAPSLLPEKLAVNPCGKHDNCRPRASYCRAG